MGLKYCAGQEKRKLSRPRSGYRNSFFQSLSCVSCQLSEALSERDFRRAPVPRCRWVIANSVEGGQECYEYWGPLLVGGQSSRALGAAYAAHDQTKVPRMMDTVGRSKPGSAVIEGAAA